MAQFAFMPVTPRSHAPRGTGYVGRSAAADAERPNMHSAAERRNEKQVHYFETEPVPNFWVLCGTAAF